MRSKVKKKILCIIDSYHWALANRAKALKENLSDVSFDIKHFNDLDKIDFNTYDIVYSLNWPIHGYIQFKINKKRKYRLVTSISSHIGQPNDKEFLKILNQYDAVSLSNNFLYQEFSAKFPKLNLYYTPFGVDHLLFKPHTKPSDTPHIFGWVGNHKREVKRFKEIEEVFSNLNVNLELKVVTQGSRFSRVQMVDFYNSVGTVICFSSSEGTPNPILEAAACGRSIISTRVGNIPELTSGLDSIQIVEDKIQLEKAILRNLQNPNILNQEGSFLRQQVDQYWNWKNRCQDFKPFLGVI